MLSAHIRMVQGLGFLAGEGQNFLHAGRVRNAAHRCLGLLADAHLLLDFTPDGFKIEAHFLEDADGDTLS